MHVLRKSCCTTGTTFRGLEYWNTGMVVEKKLNGKAASRPPSLKGKLRRDKSNLPPQSKLGQGSGTQGPAFVGLWPAGGSLPA
jgi:hypothetical protein